MNFAVSNIAWAYPDRLQAYQILQQAGFKGLEVAPGLLFAGEDDPFVPSDAAIASTLYEIADHGLTLVSMQSLLYGVEGAAMFGDQAGQDRFMTGMARAIEFAGRLAIPNLVFGNPKQRNVPDELSASQVEDIAAQTFERLADMALRAGTILSLEFNPAAYGTNFLTDFHAVHAYLEGHNHDALKMCFDVGGIYMNGQIDQAADFVTAAARKIGHVHISAPELAPAPHNIQETSTILQALNNVGYDRFVSIEMVAGKLDFPDGLSQSVAALNRAAQHANVEEAK